MQKFSQRLLRLKDLVAILQKFKAQGTLQVANRPIESKQNDSLSKTKKRGKSWCENEETNPVHPL